MVVRAISATRVDSRANATCDKRGDRALLLLVYSLAFIQGLTIQLMPVLFRSVGQAFHIGMARQGELQSAFFLGSLIVGFMGGTLFERLGESHTSVACLALLSIGTLTIAYSPSATILLLGATLFGIGNAWLTVVYSAAIAHRFSERRQQLFSWALLFVAMGGMAGPALLGFALDKMASWRQPLLVMGVLLLLGAFLLYIIGNPLLASVESYEKHGQHSSLQTLKSGRLWLIGMLFVMHALAGGTLVAWIGRLYQLRLGIDNAQAALLLSVNAGGFLLGRLLLGAFFSDKLPDRVLLALCAGGATAAISFLIFACSYSFGLVFMGLEGLLMSGDAPSISSLTAREFSTSAGVAFAIVQAMSAVGSIVAPWFVGMVGEHYGLGRAIWFGPLFMVSLAVASLSWEFADRLRTH